MTYTEIKTKLTEVELKKQVPPAKVLSPTLERKLKNTEEKKVKCTTGVQT